MYGGGFGRGGTCDARGNREAVAYERGTPVLDQSSSHSTVMVRGSGGGYVRRRAMERRAPRQHLLWTLRFGVWVFGFGVLGFGVWGLGFGVLGVGSGVWSLNLGLWALGDGR